MAMMTMRTAVSLPRSSGLLRRFSTGLFDLPASNTPSQREQAEPSENLFISGLNKRTTSEALRGAFEKFGTVVNAKVVTDRVSGYSRGFGFVQYATVEEAKQGIQGMDGKFLEGWVIFAEYAKPRTSPANQSPGQGYAPHGQKISNY